MLRRFHFSGSPPSTSMFVGQRVTLFGPERVRQGQAFIPKLDRNPCRSLGALLFKGDTEATKNVTIKMVSPSLTQVIWVNLGLWVSLLVVLVEK